MEATRLEGRCMWKRVAGSMEGEGRRLARATAEQGERPHGVERERESQS